MQLARSGRWGGYAAWEKRRGGLWMQELPARTPHDSLFGSFAVPAARQREGLGNRIQAAFAQRLAAQDTPCREQAAAPRSEAGDRNAGVGRTTRMEAATRAEQRAQQALVQRDEKKQDTGQDDEPEDERSRRARRRNRLPGRKDYAITRGRISTTLECTGHGKVETRRRKA